MFLIVLLLLIILAVGGVGVAAVHFLWPIALVLLVLWMLGFAVGRGARSGARGWYYW